MNAKNIINFAENNINTLNIQTASFSTKNTSSTEQKNLIYQLLEPVSSFTGRNDEILDIHVNLQLKNTFVVSGLGGVGKTELLRTYAKKYTNSYQHIIWINCETNVDLKKSFCGLAIELGIEIVKFKTERNLNQIIADVYNYFIGQKTLLIFDNVVSLKDLHLYMPQIVDSSTKFYCLLSSQNTEWGLNAKMILNVLRPQEARDLIKNNLPEASYDSSEEIEELIETLQHLPLALQQAIAYITDKRNYVLNCYKINDYIKEFVEEESLLNHTFPGGDVFPDYSDQKYDKTIFINIQLVLHKVKDVNALEILYIISYFAPDFINKKTLYILTDKISTDNAIRILSKYSLINVWYDWIFIHRLVQKVLRFIIKKDDDLEYDVIIKALTITAKDLSVSKTNFCFVLRHVEKKPKIYLDFYNCFGQERKSFLHFIAQNNFFTIFKTIVNSDSSYDIQNDDICVHAVGSDNVEMMIFVHMKGANINKKGPFYSTPLQIAVLRNCFKMVECLVRLNANLYCNNMFDLPPIYYGIILNYTKIVEYLIQNGYNVNKKHKLQINDDIVVDNRLPLEWTPLVVAVSLSNFETVKLLVHLGADVNCRVDNITTPSVQSLSRDDKEIFKYLWTLEDKNGIFPDLALHKACEFGCLEVIGFLVKNEADVNCKDFNEDTPLMIAISFENFEVVQFLLKNGADVNLQNLKGEFPLLQAIFSNNIDLIDWLLATECDVNLQRNDGLTSLDVSVLEGNEEITKMLLEKGAAINHNSKDALFYSILKGNLMVLKDLIAHKADLKKTYSRTNDGGYSILHLASEFGHLEMFQFVCTLDQISFEDITKNGNTVLHIACYFGHIEIVQHLINVEGASIEVDNYELNKPLHLAAAKGHLGVAKYLIEKGANVNVKNINEDTPVHLAVKHNQPKTLQFLLQNNASSINEENKNGDTALHLAVAENQVDIVKFLLENNCDINVENKYGQTPLHLASFYGYIDILYLLYEKGANINAQNSNGNTPIHLAVLVGHLNVVQFLIEEKACLKLCNKKGLLPINLAKNQNIVKELMNASQNKRFFWKTLIVGFTLLFMSYIKNKYLKK